ncbi:Extracellular serine protease precursor [compost metagenome]
MSVSIRFRGATALLTVLLLSPSIVLAETRAAPYVDTGASNKRGDACFATKDTNAAVHVLSGFLEVWTPRSAFVDAGVEAPAKDNCPAISKSDWDGIPYSATDGTIVNQPLHRANIDYVVKITRGRTAEQAFAAYLDDRRGKNASIVDGLGPLAEAWREGARQTTTITDVAADATTVKHDDDGNNRGLGSKPDEKAKTAANPDLGLAVDFINMASEEASTEPAKRYFKYARPYRWSNDVVVLPTLEPAKSQKPAEDGGFPSGHTAEAWRDAIAMAYLVPQRYQEMLTRAAVMGDNRIIAGMHSPFDVIGGRVLATAQVTYNLNRSQNADLKKQAYDQAQTWLSAKVGVESASELARFAQSQPVSSDRFADRAVNAALIEKTTTYGLPAIHPIDQPARVPEGAEVLLETRLSYLDADQRRDVLRTTEIRSGFAVLDDEEGYGRLNLFAAADGYGAFDAMTTVTMTAGKGGFNEIDTWKNDISGNGGLTKRGDGTLGLSGTNTYGGGTMVEAGLLVASSQSALGTGNLEIAGGEVVMAAQQPVLLGGTFRQADAGQLTLVVEGGKPVVVIKGAAQLGGSLVLRMTEDNLPKAGESIQLIKAGSLSGTFSKVEINGVEGNVEYTPDDVILTVGK